MSEETNLIAVWEKPKVNLNQPADALPLGLILDLKNGGMCVLKAVEPAPEWELVYHPVIEHVREFLAEVSEDTGPGTLALIRAVAYLSTHTPDLAIKDFANMLGTSMPWPSTLVNERIKLNLPFEDFAGPQTAPRVNITVNTPAINLPPTEPPIVNTVIKNELPSETIEEIDIERDSNGFMTGATKVRRRGKQPAPA